MTDSATLDPPVARRSGAWKKVLIALAVVGVIVGVLWWWSNRPIKPVTLTEVESAVVAEKIEAIQGASVEEGGEPERAEPTYEVGKKSIALTERELNGLLNKHTSLGDSLKLELATDAVHARIERDLDPDFPIIGGKTLKARARVAVTMAGEKPKLVLEDLTVWGVSVPNDWLGGLKGKNFLEEVFGGKVELSGIKMIEVKNGEILLQLRD